MGWNFLFPHCLSANHTPAAVRRQSQIVHLRYPFDTGEGWRGLRLESARAYHSFNLLERFLRNPTETSPVILNLRILTGEMAINSEARLIRATRERRTFGQKVGGGRRTPFRFQKKKCNLKVR